MRKKEDTSTTLTTKDVTEPQGITNLNNKLNMMWGSITKPMVEDPWEQLIVCFSYKTKLKHNATIGSHESSESKMNKRMGEVE